MKTLILCTMLIFCLISFSSAQDESAGVDYSSSSAVSAGSGSRGFGLGYDEGLAARFFFTEKMGVQASVYLNRIGGYDATVNNGQNAQYSELDYGIGLGVLVNLFSYSKVNLDAVAQIIVLHDGVDNPDEIGARNYGFVRVGLSPELMLADRIGLGLKLGLEIESVGETKTNNGTAVVDADDGHTDIRFFGPKNPFSGSVLGFSLFYYIGQ